MLNQAIIPPISISLQTLINAGEQAARQFMGVAAEERNSDAVPTLGTVGEAIKSEVK